MSKNKELRGVTCRVLFQTPGQARKLASAAGACRFVWNAALARHQEAFEKAKAAGERPPGVSFHALGKEFTRLRKETPWLREMAFGPVRYTLFHQAEAWKRFFAGTAERPRFKSRGRNQDSVTIPQDVKIQGDRIWFPRLGWLRIRRRGGNPYPDGIPKQAVFKRVNGRWMVSIVYEIDAPERNANGKALGVDMNVRQVAVCDGRILRLPDMSRETARQARLQRRLSRQRKGSKRRQRTRMRLQRVQRRQANIRRDWAHKTSRRLADDAQTICVEDLKVKSMTRSAKGTVESPGTNVRAKARLNHGISASGWGLLRKDTEYKAGEVIAVDPAWTSQTCSECGHRDKASRRSQELFICVACGHTANADVNAARNIKASGIGASARGEAFTLVTSAIRETDAELAAGKFCI